MVTIKVLGSGCPNCKKVEANARTAIDSLKPQESVEIVKVTDIVGISEYVMRTPGLVINDKVVSEGRVPDSSEIMTWLADALEAN